MAGGSIYSGILASDGNSLVAAAIYGCLTVVVGARVACFGKRIALEQAMPVDVSDEVMSAWSIGVY